MNLLIAGGGPAALEGALAVQRLAGDRIHVSLLSDSAALSYRPVTVTEPFGLALPQRFALDAIARERGFDFGLGRLRTVRAADQRVETAEGEEVAYDRLLLAIGARAEEAIPGALLFRGHEDAARLRSALEHLHTGEPVRVAFVAAQETAWTLPLYELALLTARWAQERGLALEAWLVTWEKTPLVVFGQQVGTAVAELLADAGVRLWTSAFAESVEDGRLWISLEGSMPIDLAVALPRPVGPELSGVPIDAHGFVPVDAYGRVAGLDRVYAAGDMTTRPLKQGGLACQQADAAAATIAAEAGADIDARAYQPVLRALLLTGERPRFLRREPREQGEVSDESPWWPPHKISGRELAPYLTAHPEFQLDPILS